MSADFEVGLIEMTGFEREPYEELLDQQERAYVQSFMFEKDRDLCFAARVLSRTMLSRFSAIEPRAWSFTRTELGRPVITGPIDAPPLVFNLSHCDGLVACVVALDRDVGIDCEDTSRKTDMLGVAESVFAPAELADVKKTPERFWRYWTLKEAYIKARGQGMSLPLDQFAFDLDRAETPSISFGPQIDDDPSKWTFFELTPTERHRVAVALRSDRSGR